MEGAESALLVLIFLRDPGKDFVMFVLTCFFFFPQNQDYCDYDLTRS